MSSSAHFKLIAVGPRRKQHLAGGIERAIRAIDPHRQRNPVSRGSRRSASRRATSIDRIASAATSQVVSRATANRAASRRWSIALTDQPSGSSQILRICLPSTFIAHPSEK